MTQMGKMDNKSFFQLSKPLEVYWFLNWTSLVITVLGMIIAQQGLINCQVKMAELRDKTDLSSEGEHNIIGPERVKGTLKHFYHGSKHSEKVSEYDQEIPQSHTADQPTAQ